MEIKSKYWKSLDERTLSENFNQEAAKEFGQDIPVEQVADGTFNMNGTRRDFLKISGFGLAAATLAACTKTPVHKAIPFLDAPIELSPSIANYYASTMYDGHDYAAVLVKTREGRPVKIEGNTLSGITKGTTNARVQASLLSLYDDARLQNPTKNGVKTAWQTLDKEVTAKLNELSAAQKTVYLLTNSIISPSAKEVIAQFIAKYPNVKHVSYDAVSYSGMLEANQASFGKAAIPSYLFDKAEVVLGIGADFLGNWIAPAEFTVDYSKNRRINAENPRMSRHIQFESYLSITGSNADSRITYKPSQEGLVVANLYNEIAKLTGSQTITAASFDIAANAIKAVAKELVANKNNSLVVCGSNDAAIQTLVNGINQMIGSYGNTINWSNAYQTKQGIDSQMEALVADINSGNAGGILVAGVNPAYDYHKAKDFVSGVKKLSLSVAFSDRSCETASNCMYVAPTNHYLESWGDAEAKTGYYSITQPAITPIFDTRQVEESLMALVQNTATYHDFIKANWQKRSTDPVYEQFWRKTLHNGIFETPAAMSAGSYNAAAITAAATKINNQPSNGLELALYEKVGLGNGVQANNPWLQELPDPISRVCWENYLAISPNYGLENKIAEGDVVRIEANGYAVEATVLVQPGLMKNVCALALGYGREKAGLVGDKVGVNAYPFAKTQNGSRLNYATDVKVSKTGKTSTLAQTQTHHSIEGRDIVKETTFEKYAKNRADGNVRPYIVGRNEITNKVEKIDLSKPDVVTLWEKRTYKGHHWKMAIDLNACTGCGTCVVACQAENNVPVVGKQEVINRREMHWIRIDRYYAFKDDVAKSFETDGNKLTKETDYGSERFDNNPDGFKFRFENKVEDYADIQVTFMPVMCQQCGNAPCETVCPVVATTHSNEGINQMTYNRCVGTRYCANNCPYKVRRFNWFSYPDNSRFTGINPSQSDLGKMVLNPDVTVRARGVMEKCTFCIQRIQAGKLKAKSNDRGIIDGEVKTACMQSCPSDAIVFGDVNDENSRVYQLFRNERAYGVIEQINVQPSVNYLTKIRNTTPKLA